jgi:hypothetical protein
MQFQEYNYYHRPYHLFSIFNIQGIVYDYIKLKRRLQIKYLEHVHLHYY